MSRDTFVGIVWGSWSRASRVAPGCARSDGTDTLTVYKPYTSSSSTTTYVNCLYTPSLALYLNTMNSLYTLGVRQTNSIQADLERLRNGEKSASLLGLSMGVLRVQEERKS